MKSKIVIKQSMLSTLTLGIFFFIVILLAASVEYMDASIRDEQIAEQRRTEFKQLGMNLANASDYLTDEARKYSVTRDPVHMYKYWEEINATRTRDNVIARLEELNSPEEEQAFLAEAKQNSDLLVNTERHSMRLVLEAEATPEREMPPEVATYHLTAEEQALNPEVKLAKAREIMFDDKYDADKRSIMAPIAQFQKMMNVRLETELAVARKATTKAAVLQIVLSGIIICVIALLIRVLFTQVSSPIKHYTQRLSGFTQHNETFILVPEGSQELRLLAQTFNTLYQSFQKELVKRRQAEETMKLSKEEAERANNAKSEFLAHMSHEIRTPLNTVIGYQYLLANTVLTVRQCSYLQNLGKAAKDLLEVVNEILDFSKIEAKKMDLENRNFDLYEMFEELCNIMQAEAQRKQLLLDYEIKNSVLRYVKGDEVRLKQVILNLLSNALKFTHQGGVHVLVEKQAENNGELALCIHVSDTGIGISQDRIAKLFEVFTQGDASITRKYGGTGLGLAICQKIVTLMHGNIQVDSTVGKGSVFRVTVRLEPADSVPTAVRESAGQELQAYFTGKKVLLVEDNDINRQMTKEILSCLGFDSETAASGFEAIDKVKAKTYDVILMDIRMPEMDGYEAARRIRALPGGITTPIAALSADAVDGAAEKARAAGMAGYLTKPLNPAKLIQVLKELVGDGGTVYPETGQAGKPVLPAETSDNLDLDSGLKRIGGKREVFRRILEQFVRHHSDDAQEIGRLLADGELEDACRLLHSVKGIAANIGAHGLKIAAGTLLSELRKGVRQKQQLQNFAVTMQQCVAGITIYMDALPVAAAEEGGSTAESDVQIIQTMLRLLDDGDSQAKRYFEAQRQHFAAILKEQYNSIYDQILMYRFDEAAEAIRQIARGDGDENPDEVRARGDIFV